MQDRFRGCLLGLACGDAVGTTVEFKPRGTFAPVTGMAGGGPFRLQPGEWTDDTSMALCLATSLLERNGFDPRDQMDRYCRWQAEGYLSSNGVCFDIGGTVASALHHYRVTGDPFSGSTDPHSAGNGSLMRLAPVPMYYVEDLAQVAHYAGESSRTTHGAREAVDACRLLGVLIARALRGASRAEVLSAVPSSLLADGELAPAIARIAAGSYTTRDRSEIRGSGYVVDCLEAALWSFYHSNSYRDAVLMAVNLGDDADSTAAVCGQLAGAYYGVARIPEIWLSRLARRSEIEDIAVRLYEQRVQP
jgi:ADP-ribosyl-[dinitrogen reductase] hydrolase